MCKSVLPSATIHSVCVAATAVGEVVAFKERNIQSRIIFTPYFWKAAAWSLRQGALDQDC